jgi:hypothetical protein
MLPGSEQGKRESGKEKAMAESSDPQRLLREFQKCNEFFVGIDSDGCAFDTMEVKHKECFIPNIIRYYNLAAVSKYAREAAEFIMGWPSQSGYSISGLGDGVTVVLMTLSTLKGYFRINSLMLLSQACRCGQIS